MSELEKAPKPCRNGDEHCFYGDHCGGTHLYSNKRIAKEPNKDHSDCSIWVCKDGKGAHCPKFHLTKANSKNMSISMKHCLYKCDNDFEFSIKDEKKYQLVRDLIWQLHEIGVVG